MKIKHLFATTLSLALVACQVAAPVNTSLNVTPKTQLAQTLTIAKPALPAIDTTASITQIGDKEQVKVQIKLPKGFRTQLAERDQLAFIKVSLKGQGISGTLTHEGAAFLPVTGDTITASIDDVPLSDNKIRVVTVQGYDAAKNPLGAFEARGYYRSEAGVKTITITLRRSLILLGRVLELALTNTALLNALDVDALQTVLEEAMGFNPDTGEFNLDPSQFDAAAILDLIPSGGSPLPTADAITSGAMLATQTVNLTINTPTGKNLGENVRLVVNDPVSRAQMLLLGASDYSTVDFANVPVGNWLISAYDSEGNLLNSTTLVVTEFGYTITDNPLMLTGALELPYVDKPRVAMRSDGGFVTVWERDDDGDGDGVYAQRYNSAGSALGSEFRVNSYTNDDQDTPDIAMDADGDFVIVWESDDQEDGNTNGIYGQRYTSAGVAQGSEFHINEYTNDEQDNPRVAMDADGDFVVTWQTENESYEYDGHTYDRYNVSARRYNQAGVAQGSEFLVNTYTGNDDYDQEAPDIAMADNGNFVITWESDAQDGESDGVYAQRYNSAAVALDSEFQVNSYTEEYQDQSAIAMDSDGDFAITWRSYGQDGDQTSIHAQRYNGTGAVQGSEFLVNSSTSGTQEHPAIAMDNNGNFVVSWQDSAQDGSYAGIYAQRYTNTGTVINSEFRVNTATTSYQTSSAIAMNSSGDFVINFVDASKGYDLIEFKLFDLNLPS